MKSRHVSRIAFIIIIMATIVVVAGCDLAMTEDDALTARGVGLDKGKAPKAFSATVNLYQDYEHVVTLDMGESNHHKTIEETLYSFQYGPFGGAVQSDWDLLNGKNVIMSNTTNYNLDPVTTEVSGSNHSVINVVDDYGAVVATIEANGVLSGPLFGAAITMNWVLKDAYGVDVQARGKVSGTFVWYLFNPDTGSVEPTLPNGTFTLTGTYN